MVTQVDHIELIVNDLEGYVRLSQAIGFKGRDPDGWRFQLVDALRQSPGQ